jgi:hypothetical protein
LSTSLVPLSAWSDAIWSTVSCGCTRSIADVPSRSSGDQPSTADTDGEIQLIVPSPPVW